MKTFWEVFNTIVFLWGFTGTTFTGTTPIVAVLKSLISQSHKRIVIEWKDWQQEKVWTITTVVDQKLYDFPDDFNRIKRLLNQDNNPLTEVPPTYFDSLNIWESNTIGSLASVYSVIEGKLALYPIPDSIVELSIYYNKITPTLTAIDDELSIKEWFEMLLVYDVLLEIYPQREDPNLYSLWERKYDRLFQLYSENADGVSDSMLLKYTPSTPRNPNDYPTNIS